MAKFVQLRNGRRYKRYFDDDDDKQAGFYKVKGKRRPLQSRQKVVEEPTQVAKMPTKALQKVVPVLTASQRKRRPQRSRESDKENKQKEMHTPKSAKHSVGVGSSVSSQSSTGSRIEDLVDQIKATTTLPHVELNGLPILDVLGHGGFGIVYKSQLEGAKDFVAVKKYKLGGGNGAASSSQFEEQLAAFLVELEAFEKVGQHPHCVRAIGYNLDAPNRTCGLILELAPHGSLTSLVEAEPGKPAAIPAQAFLTVLKQIVDGLHHLHETKLAHRDLKPDNILVFRTGVRPIVKLTDFGLLRQQLNNQTKLMTLAGTRKSFLYLQTSLFWD